MVQCVPVGSLVFVPCPSPSLPDPDNAEVSFRLDHSEEMASYDFDGSKLDAGLEENVTMAKRRTGISVKVNFIIQVGNSCGHWSPLHAPLLYSVHIRIAINKQNTKH